MNSKSECCHAHVNQLNNFPLVVSVIRKYFDDYQNVVDFIQIHVSRLLIVSSGTISKCIVNAFNYIHLANFVEFVAFICVSIENKNTEATFATCIGRFGQWYSNEHMSKLNRAHLIKSN